MSVSAWGRNSAWPSRLDRIRRLIRPFRRHPRPPHRRGRRSGIGIHGFESGGLIVDGGRRSESEIPIRLFQSPFPSSWSILLIVSEVASPLHGPAELQAFRELPPLASSLTDRLCGLVLLGLLPAVHETDLPHLRRIVDRNPSACFGQLRPRSARRIGRRRHRAHGRFGASLARPPRCRSKLLGSDALWIHRFGFHRGADLLRRDPPRNRVDFVPGYLDPREQCRGAVARVRSRKWID